MLSALLLLYNNSNSHTVVFLFSFCFEVIMSYICHFSGKSFSLNKSPTFVPTPERYNRESNFRYLSFPSLIILALILERQVAQAIIYFFLWESTCASSQIKINLPQNSRRLCLFLSVISYKVTRHLKKTHIIISTQITNAWRLSGCSYCYARKISVTSIQYREGLYICRRAAFSIFNMVVFSKMFSICVIP